MSKSTQAIQPDQPTPIPIIPIIVGLLIIFAFFMPWITVLVNISGYDLMKAGNQLGIERSWMITTSVTIGFLAIIVTTLRLNPMFYRIPSLVILVVLTSKLFLLSVDLGAIDLNGVMFEWILDFINFGAKQLKVGAILSLLSLLTLSFRSPSWGISRQQP